MAWRSPNRAHLRHSLGRVPITLARIPDEQVTALAAMGLRQLRQLFALPRDGLARRFGPGLLEHLDRMTGDRPDPRELYQPPDVFDERIELNYEVSHHPALLFPIRRLVNDLRRLSGGARWRRAAFRDRAGTRTGFATGDPDAVRIAPRKLPDTEVMVGLLAAERDPARLFDLARIAAGAYLDSGAGARPAPGRPRAAAVRAGRTRSVRRPAGAGAAMGGAARTPARTARRRCVVPAGQPSGSTPGAVACDAVCS